MRAFIPFPEFTLAQTDSVITFHFRGSEAVVVPITGEEVLLRGWPGGVDATTVAAWTVEGLRLERSVDGGSSIVEDYRVSQDGTRLIVTARVHGMGRRELRRIYDRTTTPPSDYEEPVY